MGPTGLNQAQSEVFHNFLKFGLLDFFEIAYVQVEPTKNFLGPKFGPNPPKLGLKLGFCCFLRFGSLVFLGIAYNGSLQQCLTSRRSKTHKKN